MVTNGDVVITIADNSGGQVVVPAASVQVVIGCSSSGTAAQVVATRSLPTLTSTFGYGPMCEAGGMAINAGGTILAIKATSNTTGSASAVTHTGTGGSVLSITSTNADGYYDDYCVKVLITKAGTIGVAGITFQVSLDAGRTYGPNLALNTSNTYVITNTGFTLNFGPGTVVLNDTYTFSITGPRWNTAGIQAALNALQASPYAITGFGSMHIVGPCSGSEASTIETYLDTFATGSLYSRVMLSARDGYIPVAFGGAGETEADWTTSIQTDFSAVSAKRVLVTAGHYNMPMSFANPVAGTPSNRRPLAFAQAARQVQIPPQRHSGRVRDGALSQIVVNPITDPGDGFIYHDDFLNPTLDSARFCAARTRIGLPGFYITNPNLMSPLGSDFNLLPLGNVMDIACSITYQVGQLNINSDIRLNANGTIYENEARSIENEILAAINDNMTSKAMISSATVAVDRTNNVKTTKTVNLVVAIVARGYILQENVTIGFNTTV